MMQMFVSDDDVAQLEQELVPVSGPHHLQILVMLAWHLCQRDTRRALELADMADSRLASSALNLAQRQQLAARLLLVRAKAKWLFALLDDACKLTAQVLQAMQELGEVEGQIDAHWLDGLIANDRGDPAHAAKAWRAGLALAEGLDDRFRSRVLLIALASGLAYSDIQAAVDQYGSALDLNLRDLHPFNRAGFLDFFGVIAVRRSEFANSIQFWIEATQIALVFGHVRRGIVLLTNVGDSFNNLNDHQSALEWMQRALGKARDTGWPVTVGTCLMQMGETLRRLGRLDAAQEILNEALLVLAPVYASRTYAIALAYSADLALDRRDWSAAYRTFCQLNKRADALRQPEFQIMAMRGQALALMQLHCPDSAVVAAQAAHAIAIENQDPLMLISVLTTLAEIHARYSLPAPSQIQEANPQLHYLKQAEQVATTISGYIIPGDLLDALADAHAVAGDYASALQVARAAREARDKTHSQEATNRAIALQVRHQTERAESEREYHQQLAQTEAKRVAVLQHTSDVLAHLGAIGQEITAQLEVDGLFQALNQHVHRLLDVSSFTIFLLDADGEGLSAAFSVEQGQTVALMQVPLSSNIFNSARCARERREIMINIEPGQLDPTLIPGTLPTLSRLFAPLMIGERVLGVMTIQSLREHAYGERDLLIFRTLCAYGAIALDNANAYQQLQQAQSQLVAQEKLAALGSLVSGVAHELNSPIGNSILMTSALEGKATVMHDKIMQQRLRQSDLDEFLQDTQETASLILKNLTTAAELVSSFKQVAVDRTSAKRRVFNLHQTCQEIVTTFTSQLRLSGHSIDILIDDDIIMDGYPGPLGQVLGNLLNNALLHAFDGIANGKMTLAAKKIGQDHVLITFMDNGIGIAEKNLPCIFDPFFTTKSGQGDSGLGMNIVYNIVTSLLSGKITVESELGKGTTVVLDLPLTVALVAEAGAEAA
jgi:signal transduction histidine kinase